MPLLFSAPVDAAAVAAHALELAAQLQCRPDTLAALRSFLAHPVTQGILSLPPDRLDAYLCNDLYKPRMHALYAELAPGVQLDFALNVRRTPAALAAIRAEDPELWAAFLAACTRRLSAPPYPAPILDALRRHPGGFVPPPPALARAERDGVAPLRWQEAGGQLAAFASGHSEAASHVETTLTQVVQELVVAAQVRRVRRARGAAPAAEALLGGALAALARGVERLNAEAHPEDEEEEEGAENGREGATQVVLFAGRRSSSRRYLLLQNWYCRLRLRGFAGTSSLLAAALLDEVAAACGAAQEDVALLRSTPLVGTLAHEVVMAMDQLLSPVYNRLPRGASAQICALLAHLCMLRAAGGLRAATALADTFGTPGFVAAALAARLPPAFREDAARVDPEGWAALPPACTGPGAVVFDLFRTWRLDSGDYERTATLIVGAWERRWGAAPPQDRPPRPALMHSNLSSYDEVIAAARLPRRIRPHYLCFGTLADGFPPLPVATDSAALDGGGGGGGGDAGPVQIRLASLVMKAVQARHPAVAVSPGAECAGKLGDGGGSKLQLDPRLPPADQERVRRRLLALSTAAEPVDADAASAALAAAYEAVTRGRLLA